MLIQSTSGHSRHSSMLTCAIKIDRDVRDYLVTTLSIVEHKILLARIETGAAQAAPELLGRFGEQ
jgi:hypothetical protein